MGNGFHMRLFAALLLTLAAVGAIQYRVLASDARESLIEDERAELAADATGVATAYSTTAAGQVPLNAVNRYLRAMAARPGNERVTLVDPSFATVGSATVLGIGSQEPDPRVRATIREGHEVAGGSAGDREGNLLYTTPVDLPKGRHALVVRQRSEVLDARLAGLRRSFLLLLLGGLVLAVPAFYVLGGRSLGRLHRTAVDRATRDGLTDLGNHRAFQDELRRAVSLARRHGEPLALALVDIDDFKFENDRHGHDHGDRMLRVVAGALREARAEDRAFRVGDDEFALLAPRTTEAGARRALERTTADLELRHGIRASAGLASLGADTEDVESLRDQVDAAVYEAKRRGGATIVSFGEIEDQSRVVTVPKVRGVRRLLDEGGMAAAYQPVFDLGRRSVLGFEGLARPSEEYGLAGPGEAFDVAAAIGRSAELDEVCRRAVLAGADRLPAGALLFLNVAPQSLDDGRLPGDSLVRLVEAVGLTPDRVVLEITERFSGQVERVVGEAANLRSLGFKLALDDVGAGNSGLEMLRKMAVDFVKVDRQVVSRALEDPSARAVLASVTTFARQTGAYVIAEGVETEAELALARDPGLGDGVTAAVQGVQGYLLGRPGPLPTEVPEIAPERASAGFSLRPAAH